MTRKIFVSDTHYREALRVLDRADIPYSGVPHPTESEPEQNAPPPTLFMNVGGLYDPFRVNFVPSYLHDARQDMREFVGLTAEDVENEMQKILREQAQENGKHSPQAEPGTMEVDGVDADDVVELTPPPEMDPVQNALVFALREVFGDDARTWDDGVKKTAARVIRYWQEFAMRPPSELDAEVEFDFPFTAFPAHSNQLVICKDIEFSSLCAHHLLPFYGTAHIGYVPHKLQVGLSKLPRLVDFWARRPQVQEQLTEQIASSLKDKIEAMGVAVVIEARHTCMACRGVRKHNGIMTTSNMKGVFLTAPAARAEFLAMIDRRGV